MTTRCSGGRPEYFFAGVAVVFGLMLAFITAPFQSPDEPAHFLRIWQLSEGKIVADHYGGTLPTSLGECFVQFLSLTCHAENKTSFATIRNEFHRQLQPARRQFILFPNTAIYSPVPYLPQICACLIGRLLLLPPIALMYLERCATVFAYAALGWLTLRALPMLRWAACLVLLAPTPLFLAGSLSADPVTTGLTFLTCALILKLIKTPGHWQTITLLAICLVGTALCKWVYFTTTLLLLAVPATAWGKPRAVVPIGVTLVALAAAGAWSRLSSPMHVPLLNGDPQPQLHWMETHPAQFLKIVAHAIQMQGKSLLWESLGGLGWLDFYLPSSFIILYLLIISWMAINDRTDFTVSSRMRILCAVAVSASIALIFACDYLVWNTTASPTIDGLQGRYFLPLGLMTLITFKSNGRYPIAPVLVKCFSLFSCLLTVWTVRQRYY